MLLSRRDLIDLTLRAAAAAGGTDFLRAWLKQGAAHAHPSNPAPPEPPLLRNYQPKFFSAEDFDALQAFTEILIPTDDTAGAREAHCAHFIDFLLDSSTGVNPDLQRQWRDAMSALKTAGFHAGDAAARAKIVADMARPEVDRTASHPGYATYRLIKQQNTFAFYTSRAGMIETLDYRGNSVNAEFPACNHPEHQVV
jgi:gluconate 2-dehydrogenase subunit 3-like protein